MKKQILRVGFDLDGVILYNPARIIRPIIASIKRLFFHKTRLKFYYPQSPLEKSLWHLFHKSSIFIAPGLDDIKELIKEKKIIAYIVTARYSFLGTELKRWVKKHNLNSYFSEVYYNEKNEQPHLFKERMIKKLKLDIFVEDNWDIIHYLSTRSEQTCLIYWIYNIFDRGLAYRNKFPYLAKAVLSIKHYAKQA